VRIWSLVCRVKSEPSAPEREGVTDRTTGTCCVSGLGVRVRVPGLAYILAGQTYCQEEL
jgi:hypothetical protein